MYLRWEEGKDVLQLKVRVTTVVVNQAAVSTSMRPSHLPHQAPLISAAACTCRTPCRRFLVVLLVAVGPSFRRCQRVRTCFPTRISREHVIPRPRLDPSHSPYLIFLYMRQHSIPSAQFGHLDLPGRHARTKLGCFAPFGSGTTFRPSVQCTSGFRIADASDASELLTLVLE